MRILLATLWLTLLASCATVGKDQAKVVFELQEAAEISYRQGHYEEALSQYQKLVRHLPLSLHAWLRLGNCHARLGAYNEAVSAYQTALAIDDTYANAWINLAYVQSQILSQTVANMYQRVSPTDPQAERVRRLVETVLKPFAADQEANPESQTPQLPPESHPVEIDREQ